MFLRLLRLRFIPAVLTLFLFVTLQGALFAQNKQGDVKSIFNARKFALYEALKGDTPYSISKKFNLNIEDLLMYNPQLNSGIHQGDELRIPTPFSENSDMKPNTGPVWVKYVVGRKETLYSIARMLNTTQEDILRKNPSIKGALDYGTVLLIPGPTLIAEVQPKQSEIQKPAEIQKPFKSKDGPDFKEYTIQHGDNYYQFQQKFGLSRSDLEQLNPELKEGIKLGMVIKIPCQKSANTPPEKIDKAQTPKVVLKIDENHNSVPTPEPKLNKTFEVGIYLPLYQNANDSTRSTQHSDSYLEFYSGVLMATQKLTEAGMKLKLYVYDTNQDSDDMKVLVKKPEFLSLDLIIGPVFPRDQKIIAELSYKNHIPMVSPLSSDNRYVATTPGYYLINPGKNIRLTSTADYVSANFTMQNIILLNHGNDQGDEKYLLDKLNQKMGIGKVHVYNILTDEAAGLEALIKEDTDNIFILAEESEANVSIAMTRLNTISKSHRIKVIGLQEYTRMQSIDIEYLHNVNMLYLAPYFVDYSDARVNSFIEKYRASFGSEPTQYSFQGYDVALHFMASFKKSGKNFPANNPNPGVDLLQSDYSFQNISPLGGYINRTLYVIEYTSNYDLRVVEKIKGSVVSAHEDGKDSE